VHQLARPLKDIAIVGGGWAGLSAAVAATGRGHRVTLFEMAPHLGGRARSVGHDPVLDNGQHILIGAYRDTLALMRTVGVDLDAALLRRPLRLRYPQHEGLALPVGRPLPAFVRGVLANRAWPLAARGRLLWAATGWLLRGFRCAPDLSVSALCAGLPLIVRQQLIEPLCVAALNTPAPQASAQVFLRVLRDALFSGPGSSDLMLPRQPLSALMAEPARAWLAQHGARIECQRRVQSLDELSTFDAVVLACTSTEAARLAAPRAPAWAAQAAALRFEPIVTVYLHSPGTRLPAPMVALADEPAQFVFDLGQLGHGPDVFAFVISGAAPWVARGLEETGVQALAQARRELAWQTPPTLLRTLAEKRATFACTPGLARPSQHIAAGLVAAGDYVEGPYPATLEGAVRSGQSAIAGL
jgi:squalene-associated FAD-dependent desaturase